MRIFARRSKAIETTMKNAIEKHGAMGTGRRVLGALSYITSQRKRGMWMRSFRIWQHRPHQVAPMSEDRHVCASCGTAFVGNYCPRCGQSAKIGRYSLAIALQHLLDVWGIGNRSMFRTVRDLIFRPGYMIRDYLKGMQSAYFPPFEMFFVLATFSLMVDYCRPTDAEGESQQADPIEISLVEKDSTMQVTKPEHKHAFTIELDSEEESGDLDQRKIVRLGQYTKWIRKAKDANPTLFWLVMMIVFSLPLYLFFRHTPRIRTLSLSEFVVALVYTSNTYSIFDMASRLLDSSLLECLAVMMFFVSFKQLSGFSKRRVFCYLLLTCLIALVVLIGVGFGLYLLCRKG